MKTHLHFQYSILLIFSAFAFLQTPSLLHANLELSNQMERPVFLLINGVGQRKTWDHTVSFFEKDCFLTYGGRIKGNGEPNPKTNLDADFFILQYEDTFGSVNQQVAEIRHAVTTLYAHKKRNVILFGYSYGGLNARIYLTRYLTDHHVSTLITLHSPHLGSQLSLGHSYALKINSCEKWKLSNFFGVNYLCEAAKARFFEFEQSTVAQLDSKAVKDLQPPNYVFEITVPQKYLELQHCLRSTSITGKDFDYPVTNCGLSIEAYQDLRKKKILVPHPQNAITVAAHAQHPSDVIYISLVGAVKQLKLNKYPEFLSNSLFNFYQGSSQTELTEELLELGGSPILSAIGYKNIEGDGVVSLYSQNMSNIPWFQANHMDVETINTGRSHTESLFAFAEIAAALSASSKYFKEVWQ